MNFGKNLKNRPIYSKNAEKNIFVTLTSLKGHCDVKCRATDTFLESIKKKRPIPILSHQNHKNWKLYGENLFGENHPLR